MCLSAKQKKLRDDNSISLQKTLLAMTSVLVKWFLSLSLIFLSTVVMAKETMSTLTVMTFNIENGGTQISFDKVVEAIHNSGADVVGIQEAWGNIDRLAKALHWQYFSRSQHIISRLPLLEPAHEEHPYLWIEVEPKKYVAFANLHLPDDSYGPDRARAGAAEKDVITLEKQARLKFAMPVIKQLTELVKQNIPVFLTGDFNSPSHLDWIFDNKKIAWPVTQTLAQQGFKDAYRSTHPDPFKSPGFTWPAMRPKATVSFDGFNPTANDIPERIDFIFASSNTEVIHCQLIGEASYQHVDLPITPWPSDHRALVAIFKVKPVELTNTPQISVSTKTVKVQRPFKITWRNSPGFRFDYIRINPIHSKKLAYGETIRLYTKAKKNGSILFNEKVVKGNWLAWYKAEQGYWPLQPGIYEIKLMADDSETVLAETTIKVIG